MQGNLTLLTIKADKMEISAGYVHNGSELLTNMPAAIIAPAMGIGKPVKWFLWLFTLNLANRNAPHII